MGPNHCIFQPHSLGLPTEVWLLPNCLILNHLISYKLTRLGESDCKQKSLLQQYYLLVEMRGLAVRVLDS